MNSQKNFRSLDLIFAILCILFFLGTIFVFHPLKSVSNSLRKLDKTNQIFTKS